MSDLILRNSARCGRCGAELVSEHRHDFVGCGCPNASFVDGGLVYLRRTRNVARRVLRVVRFKLLNTRAGRQAVKALEREVGLEANDGLPAEGK